mmetsp:Transcript_115247/g.200607  ORF Transcript_115247/g.200607 Transcript_115247/m.200607 type:complete len:206 (+) Transcript_115247:1448-2065(+)
MVLMDRTRASVDLAFPSSCGCLSSVDLVDVSKDGSHMPSMPLPSSPVMEANCSKFNSFGVPLGMMNASCARPYPESTSLIFCTDAFPSRFSRAAKMLLISDNSSGSSCSLYLTRCIKARNCDKDIADLPSKPTSLQKASTSSLANTQPISDNTHSTWSILASSGFCRKMLVTLACSNESNFKEPRVCITLSFCHVDCAASELLAI